MAPARRGLLHAGHRNAETVKGVSFLGEDDRYVMSGSDDGHIYIWTKADGILRQWLKGDRQVVNCLEPHPCQPLSFASSGEEIDLLMSLMLSVRRNRFEEGDPSFHIHVLLGNKGYARG